MNPAMGLLRASAAGPSALEAFLQTHDLTPQLATEVRERFLSFLKTDQFDNAELAASVLAVLWLRLGNFREVLRNILDHLQLRFRRAESVEEYAHVRSGALDALGKAVDLDEHEFAFRAAVLAADSSYFAYRVGGEASGLSISLMLADLVAAAHRARGVAESTWFPRFLSLAAAITQTATAEHPSTDERVPVDCALREFAGEIRAFFPIRRHFPDDPKKASHLAGLFTALADRYNPGRGDQEA